MAGILLRPRDWSAGQIVVAIAVVALIATGAAVEIADARRLVPCPEGRLSTTDIYLAQLGVPGPSATIERALSSLGPGALMFTGYGDQDTFVKTYYALSYLTLPRQLGEVGCGLSGRPPVVAVMPAADGASGGMLAATVCYVTPCGSEATFITPDLAVNTEPRSIREVTWQSFCSQ